MKKLDVRFDTEKVNEKLFSIAVDIGDGMECSKSEIVRAALNIGMKNLLVSNPKVRIKLIEDFK